MSLLEVLVVAESLPEGPKTVFVIDESFGLRIGEVLSLKVEDIDFEHRLWAATSRVWALSFHVPQ